MRLSRKLWPLTVPMVLSALFSPTARAQDLEPNNTCATASDGGEVWPALQVAGSLEGAAPPPSDVDFVRFNAMPGLGLSLLSTTGRVAVFTESCQPIVASGFFDASGVDFKVPDSGVFIVAVANFLDGPFDGSAFENFGPYRLRFASTTDSVSGRLVDRTTGAPIGGDGAAWVRLRCLLVCGSLDAVQNVGPDGVFRIEGDIDGRRLQSGEYELTANAAGFEQLSLRFTIGTAEVDFGDLSLAPISFAISNARACANLPATGGTCQYSVTITNASTRRQTAVALSQVSSTFQGIMFEASTRRLGTSPERAQFRLSAGARRDVTFFFNVPPFVPNGSMICASMQVGVNPTPEFNVAQNRPLFCIRKGSTSFQLMSPEESRATFERMGLDRMQ